ncbi:hypothetical protein FJT64_015251 [Amphibalanus amphitrite]|uniref:IgA-specific serine endopeptidase autotransporter n=1 Tax=Amphibalanus amphitrite TaxID=1232801 RepID=A0A6A4X7Q4_AMPAM|nr:hypothetical protein FJT64_015251 [Amphibalanus amphitrite]
MSDKRSRHDSDAKSHQSRRSSYHTRSEASFSKASSGLSEARRRAALSQLQAEQAQRAAAAKAELARRLAEADAEQARRQAEQARRQAEAQAEQARRQAEAQAEQARQQAEAQAEQSRRQAEAQAALQAQAAKDEAEYRQLELELLEQEERGSQHPRSSAAPSVAGLPVVATEPPAQVCVSRQTDESVTRTRQWLTQSQLHVPPVDTAPVSAVPPPAMRLQRPSSDDTRAVPHLPRITLEKFGGSAIEWPRWIALFKALVHDRADLTDVERLTYLQTHLTGPARESVRGMLCDASLYSTALCELEREFGDPSRVIHATMKRLLTARPVKDGDLSALTELSRELHTALEARCQQLEKRCQQLEQQLVGMQTRKSPRNSPGFLSRMVSSRPMCRDSPQAAAAPSCSPYMDVVRRSRPFELAASAGGGDNLPMATSPQQTGQRQTSLLAKLFASPGVPQSPNNI